MVRFEPLYAFSDVCFANTGIKIDGKQGRSFISIKMLQVTHRSLKQSLLTLRLNRKYRAFENSQFCYPSDVTDTQHFSKLNKCTLRRSHSFGSNQELQHKSRNPQLRSKVRHATPPTRFRAQYTFKRPRTRKSSRKVPTSQISCKYIKVKPLVTRAVIPGTNR